MQRQLKDKFALVTGGGTGIGRAIALMLAEHGADVAVCGRSAAPLEETVQQVRARGQRGLAVVADIGMEADVKTMMARIVRELGGLDILINNASIVGQVGPVSQTDLAQWEQCIRINLTGTMLCCREAIAYLIARGGGAIVNVSSNVGRRGYPNRAPYVCTKWAQIGLTQTLAHELAAHNIRVNAICPGPVMTARLERSMKEMSSQRGIASDDLHDEWANQSPMKRFATEEECARVTLFLVTEASSAMTGQALNVTCGMMMT
jgi:NAD(P)-dependent dehydrogenase (short-subunit alcohol dehydrogenase family)